MLQDLSYSSIPNTEEPSEITPASRYTRILALVSAISRLRKESCPILSCAEKPSPPRSIVSRSGLQVIWGLSVSGAGADYVAHSLVLDDSTEAWNLRNELTIAGADPGWISLGLARVFTDRSIVYRRELLKSGASIEHTLLGINGDYLTGGILSISR